MTARFILAISTSSGVAKVAAVSQEGAELFSFDIVDYKSQSAQLLPLIQQHMQKANVDPSLCAAIAVDIGPGGFTSLRTACGIAQGLAVGWSVPTVPLTSFECMLPALMQAEPITVLMDARLNEIYAAKVHRTGQGTQWDLPPYLLPITELQNVSGLAVCDAHLHPQFPVPRAGVFLGAVSAVRLAQLAWQEFEAGRVSAPFDCQPLYVRDKVAQTTSERQALKHGAF
ncbi:tRNA (adenosine(37)-N6)-threonylcarbamoyltransferase complex dimerization subunit type 1 TsaB [Limnobacter parvus]|uniref:tRNA (Adenosine(37)-N6)-threonylcarbamoyltransferase complex dimerization subunit type 1 TsaB n=1 Tax=Limnobacter parvus TaxID=2939690 RepID=A0ABT1XJU5_9BURK|nr:tRNA (adenosine(37)-N6)-threonylcarbamoyltransferase complex dimerization subunit type 1 TsaB [Limnobacter parvus]MCR2747562.1 tRNA (adenosine(37)-N6)-threonylcarbamoyltransferase complex dimerization subunit type 1 TsaB [Limnobacter parvus]